MIKSLIIYKSNIFIKNKFYWKLFLMYEINSYIHKYINKFY